jgi:Fe-S cluster assembly protein SufB
MFYGEKMKQNEELLLQIEKAAGKIHELRQPEKHSLSSGKGLNEEVIRMISKDKKEPEWMLKKRLDAYKLFKKTPVPKWGIDLSDVDFDEIVYYAKPDAKQTKKWEEVPEDVKKTFEMLGIPETERKALAGVGAQYDSSVVYHNLKDIWEKQGVIFEDMDVAVQKYPELVKEYFMTKCIPIGDHKLIMLHAAVWSGGSFIYVPKGVKIKMPLQAYFRMNAKRGGQFEHTLIIAEEGSELSYIEGCFTKGNIVTANPDYKKIEEVKQGDKVLTHEGVFKANRGLQVRPYSGEIYGIDIYGDSTQKIEATAEHPFLYVDRHKKRDRNKIFKPRWNMPKFFKKGDYLVVPINKIVKKKSYHEFEIDRGNGRGEWVKKKIKVPLTKEFYRLVGYYLAEGSVSSNSYLNFSFGIHEKEYVEDVKKCLKKVFSVHKIHEFIHKKNNGISLVVCSVDLARIFKQLGNKNYTKALPSWMIYETKDNQKEIIKGWFRGDGNYYNKRTKTSGFLKESFRINTTSEKLTRQGRDILLRLGCIAFINKRDRSREGRKVMYTLGVTGDYLKKFGEIVGKKIHEKVNGKNRASMFGLDSKFAYLPIKKIIKREVKNLPVYNFSVDNHETYTVGGVVVHNCSAPQYNTNSLHAGGVEIFVKQGARVRYSSVENWSKSTYNLNTKRAVVEKDGIMEWVGGNAGSKGTMLYPCSILKGEGARADHLGIAYAGEGQNQDTGAKIFHLAKNTSSTIKMKSISKGGGVCTYRGLVKVMKGATNSRVGAVCDALIIDEESKSNTIPVMEINEKKVEIAHEASVGKLSAEKLFYLMSRGLNEDEAIRLIVSGFIEPIMKELPMEYSVELNRLIQLDMTGSVG